jgi:dihydropteroate synthase
MNANEKIMDFSESKVMGILNLTPDSFFDGGKYLQIDRILERVREMLDEGADIIDAGACSTRPGASDIGSEEEMKRLIPVISELKASFPEIILSIDTYRADVAEKAILSGADMINDISGGGFDDRMYDVVAEAGLPYVLMHIKGRPQNMQAMPEYKHILSEIYTYFEEKINKLQEKGIEDIILDPGFGFGKTTEHNFILLGNLDYFKALSHPLMVGISRKSMITKTLNTISAEALNGTTVAHTIALMKGADVLRVHDIRAAKETIRMVQMLKRSSDLLNEKITP